VTPTGLALREVATDSTIEQVKAATGATLRIDGQPGTF
jgi:acyl CoA:acetate/3-ketoacid CoA transferase beta subunit